MKCFKFLLIMLLILTIQKGGTTSLKGVVNYGKKARGNQTKVKLLHQRTSFNMPSPTINPTPSITPNPSPSPSPTPIDTNPPYITDMEPEPEATHVPSNTRINFTLNDDESGLDFETFVVLVQGEQVTFTVEGDIHQASITITPEEEFNEYEQVQVSVYIEDYAGNSLDYDYTFRIADESPPFVEDRNPAAGEENVPIDSPIIITIADTYSGINLDSIIFLVNNEPVQFTTDGDKWHLTITYLHEEPFPQNSRIDVYLSCEDEEGNSMQPEEYYFMTGTNMSSPTPSPTPLPTATFTPTLTPTIAPSPTSTPSPTPTSTSTPLPPTSTPTPSPTPHYECKLSIRTNKDYYHAGELFKLELTIDNRGSSFLCDLYIVLDVYGNYYFYPSWGENLDFDTIFVAENNIYYDVILEFIFPAGAGQGNNITFYSGITFTGTFDLICPISQTSFSYYS